MEFARVWKRETGTHPYFGLAINMIITQKERVKCGHESGLSGRTGVALVLHQTPKAHIRIPFPLLALCSWEKMLLNFMKPQCSLL